MKSHAEIIQALREVRERAWTTVRQYWGDRSIPPGDPHHYEYYRAEHDIKFVTVLLEDGYRSVTIRIEEDGKEKEIVLIFNAENVKVIQCPRLNHAYVFCVAKEFSLTPGPRGKHEGSYSGEELLKILQPLFERAQVFGTLRIDLDGTSGYAAAFLEEVFGGLARIYGSEEVMSVVELASMDEPYLRDEVIGYIRGA